MFNSERYVRLLDYMKAHEDEIIRDLCLLCSMPSVRSESCEKSEPFGKDCAVCLEKTAKLFSDGGFEARVYAESGYALATGGNRKSEKTICLYAHTDVVPVNAEDWTVTQPFEPKVIGNSVVARGVRDNKNAVVAAYYFLKALDELKIASSSAIQIFLGSNEESGMADIKAFAREQRMPQISIVPDAGYPAAIGQKGIWRFNVRSCRAFTDIANISGGEAYNIVLDKITAKIKRSDALYRELMAKKTNDISVQDGNFITVTATGKSAHAAYAERGINALMLLAKFLMGIDSLSKNDRDILSVAASSLSDSCGKALGIDSHSEFFGNTTCACGIAKTVDGHLEYTFDIRFGNLISEEEMQKRVIGYFKERDFDFIPYTLSHCMKRDESSMPIKTFMETYRAITGNAKSKPYVMGGGTYAYHVDGGFAIGVETWDNEPDIKLPAGHGNVHQADELLCIPNFINGIAMMSELILSIDDNPVEDAQDQAML